ncbi:MAG: hypothetical protein F6K58_18945, partial [Symploca sp. SIO2E9]|nr:hypothetical protein [Symploca sp. SIO2E9]
MSNTTTRVSENKSGGTSKQTPRRPDAQTPRIKNPTKISLTPTTIEPINKHCKKKQGSSFFVRNEGVYLAHLSVSYKFQGQDLSQDSGKFILGESRSIAIPTGATEIHLKVELVWFTNSRSTLFTQSFP